MFFVNLGAAYSNRGCFRAENIPPLQQREEAFNEIAEEPQKQGG